MSLSARRSHGLPGPGHRADQRLPGGPEVGRGLAVLGRAVTLVGSRGGGLCAREKGRGRRSRSFVPIRAYAVPGYPAARRSPLNGTLRKSRHCDRVQCSAALSVLLFGSVATQRAAGRQNEQRTAGPFRADGCPAGNPLHILSASLISTHEHTEETWLGVSPFSLPFFSPHCLCVLWLPSRFGFSKMNERDG